MLVGLPGECGGDRRRDRRVVGIADPDDGDPRLSCTRDLARGRLRQERDEIGEVGPRARRPGRTDRERRVVAREGS
jgi:hypothetical protein